MHGLAKASLEKSNRLLPTPLAHYLLGKMDLKENRIESAIKHFRTASIAKSKAGIEAKKALVRLEVPRKPAKYIASRADWDNVGRVIIQLQNRSQVMVLVAEVRGQLTQKGSVIVEERLSLNISLEAGQTRQLVTRLQISHGKDYRLRSLVSRASVK